jgi:TRAP-type C4-dicarboxylate transport system substrate-binding protein
MKLFLESPCARGLAALALLALAAPARADDRKPVRLATLAPKGSSLHKLLLAMGERLRAAPEGGVKLVVYADGTMGGESEMVRKMRIKQLQAGLLTASGLEQIDESINALQNLPLVFRDLGEVAAVRERLAPLLKQRFEAKGFVLLFLGDIGFVRYFSKQPIRVPEDLKKARLFTMPGNVRQVDLMKSLGLNPQPLEPTDILPALQTGLIDCVPTIPLLAQIDQFYKPAPYMLDLEWAPLVGGCVILKETFDALPATTRSAILEIGRDTGEQVVARNRIESDESVAAMKSGGLTVITPTQKEVQAWRDFVQPVYPKLRGTQVQADLYDIVMETLRARREQKATKDAPPAKQQDPPGGSKSPQGTGSSFTAPGR